MPEQPIDLAAIEARFANATGGRWEGYRRRDAFNGELFGITAHDHPTPGDSIDIIEDEGVRPEDIEFLANAPADIAALVRRVWDLQDQQHRLLRWIEAGVDYFRDKGTGNVGQWWVSAIVRVFGPTYRPDYDTSNQAIADVLAERARQDAKWGQQNHDDGTGPVTMPLASRWDSLHETDRAHYLAETFRRRCERRFSSSADGLGTWRDIFLEEAFEALAEDDPVKLRAELVQSAAVLIAWIEAIDRRTAAPDA